MPAMPPGPWPSSPPSTRSASSAVVWSTSSPTTSRLTCATTNPPIGRWRSRRAIWVAGCAGSRRCRAMAPTAGSRSSPAKSNSPRTSPPIGFLHLDADEIPQSPVSGSDAGGGVRRGRCRRLRAVEFRRPSLRRHTRGAQSRSSRFRRTMRWHIRSRRDHTYRPRLEAPAVRDLVSTGGHQAQFRHRRIRRRRSCSVTTSSSARAHASEIREPALRRRRGPQGLARLASEHHCRQRSAFLRRPTALYGHDARSRLRLRLDPALCRMVMGRETEPDVTDARPLVLCIVDRPGWADDRKTRHWPRSWPGSTGWSRVTNRK